MKKTNFVLSLFFLFFCIIFFIQSSETVNKTSSPFVKENLVAWCIVPFDAEKRNPQERAQMLKRLGICKMAYDWRAKDIPFFEDEIDALRSNNIELTAFWIPTTFDPASDQNTQLILDLFERKNVKTQIWITLPDGPMNEMNESERIEACVKVFRYLGGRARKLGCSVALYNHGGWFGEPENQIKIIEKVQMDNVGIVYNLHHGHEHLARFNELFQKMKPYLLAFNLNGMHVDGPMILPIGDGDREQGIMKLVLNSGFKGPIGILDHRNELDTEQSLKENLEGMKKVLKEIGDTEALKTY